MVQSTLHNDEEATRVDVNVRVRDYFLARGVPAAHT